MKEGVERYLEGGEGVSRNQSCGRPGGGLGGDQSQGFRCKKRRRDDSRPGWWKYQSGMDW